MLNYYNYRVIFIVDNAYIQFSSVPIIVSLHDMLLLYGSPCRLLRRNLFDETLVPGQQRLMS